MPVRRYASNNTVGYGVVALSQVFPAREKVSISFRDELPNLITPNFPSPQPGNVIVALLNVVSIFTYLRLAAGRTSIFNADLSEGKYAKVSALWYGQRTGETFLNYPTGRVLSGKFADIFPFNTDLPCDLAPETEFPTLSDALFIRPGDFSLAGGTYNYLLCDEYEFYPFTDISGIISLTYSFSWNFIQAPATLFDPVVVIGI